MNLSIKPLECMQERKVLTFQYYLSVVIFVHNNIHCTQKENPVAQCGMILNLIQNKISGFRIVSFPTV